MERAARDAAASAADASVRLQADDGSWRGFNDAGPMFVGETIACEAALGTLTAEHAFLAKKTLLDHQLPDGGLHPWPGASSSNAEATLFLIAGLKAVGASDDDPALMAARVRLAALGGARRAGPLASTIAALVGAVDAALLPRVPAELALLPGHDALVARLLGVNALVPLRALPFLWQRARAGAFRLGRPTEAAPPSAVARQLERYLRDRQDPSGGIAGVPIFTLLGLLCLAACGVGGNDEAVVRGLAYVRRVYHPKPSGLAIEPYESSYWDTAHMVRALARAPEKRHRDAARR
ncbi:MAG: hypothetical protein HOV80_26865, partial [Polyangiaceae bacterium]|nr:hypothetical protein [Polyangiaceae bacterium]